MLAVMLYSAGKLRIIDLTILHPLRCPKIFQFIPGHFVFELCPSILKGRVGKFEKPARDR